MRFFISLVLAVSVLTSSTFAVDSTWTASQWSTFYDRIVGSSSSSIYNRMTDLVNSLSRVGNSLSYKTIQESLGYPSSGGSVNSQLTQIYSAIYSGGYLPLGQALGYRSGNGSVSTDLTRINTAIGQFYTGLMDKLDEQTSNAVPLAEQTGFKIYDRDFEADSGEMVTDLSFAEYLYRFGVNLTDSFRLSSQDGFTYYQDNQYGSSSGYFPALMSSVSDALVLSGSYQMLSARGEFVDKESNKSLARMVNEGIQGLAYRLSGDTTEFDGNIWSFDADGVLDYSSETYYGGFPAVVALLGNMNEGMHQLVNVQANPAEQKIADDAKADRDAFNKDFQGDGKAAAGDNIGSMGSISGDMSGLFETGASPDQFASGVSGAFNSWFSQETKDQLTYAGPSLVAEGEEEEYTHFYEDSRREFEKLLSGGGS